MERVVRTELTVQCSYAQVEEVKRDVLLREGEILQADYAERCLLRVAVARSAVEGLTENWTRIGVEVKMEHR
ncbi:MAG: hypothetical protein IPI95_16165 [Flavobacteriales bacterium]|nr:hypothetical protein [Flavobacteriales bacterium]